jgi:hypothetical protein
MLSAVINSKQLSSSLRPVVPGQRKSDAFTAYAAVHELGRSIHQPAK